MDGEDEVIRKPVFTEAPIITSSDDTKNVFVKGNTVHNYQYIQPKRHTINEKINIIEGETKNIELDAIVKENAQDGQVTFREVEVPAQKIYMQDYVQPVITDEKLKLKYKTLDDEVYNYEPYNLKAKINEKKNVVTKDVTGGNIYRQQTIYPQVTNEKVELEYAKAGPQYFTAEVQMGETEKKHKEVEKYFETVYHKLPEFHDEYVPVDIVHNVPVYKDVPLYVEMPGNEDINNYHEFKMGSFDWSKTSSSASGEAKKENPFECRPCKYWGRRFKKHH